MGTPTRPEPREERRGKPARTPETHSPVPEQAAAVLRLQRMAGNSAVKKLVLAREPWWEKVWDSVWDKDDDKDDEKDDKKDEAVVEDATTESIRTALSEVKVSKREEKVTGAIKPWEIFKHAIGNTQEKKQLYGSYKTAVKAQQKAAAAVAGAKKALAGAAATMPEKKKSLLVAAVPKAELALEKATKASAVAQAKLRKFVKGKVWRWSPDKELKGLEKEVKDAKSALKKVKKGGDKAGAQKKLDDATSRYKARLAILEKEVEDMSMEAGDFTRTRYTITVGDTSVSLHDHVEAYATIIDKGLEGSARRSGGSGETVDQLVDKDKTISTSTKAILKLVSSFEGKFSSVNTWDQADVTWGFIQWTTGKSGEGSLIETLLACKDHAPKVFHERLGRYGINVTKGDGLVITSADGSVKKGKAAAQQMQVDPVLTAILSAAGEDPEFKVAQLRHANDKVGKEVLRSTISVGGKKVKLGDILTSELGVGGAFNRAVHAGAGAVRDLLSSAVAKHIAKHKIDTTRPASEWAPTLEPVCIEALKGAEPDRMRTMATKLSATAGSYR